MDDLTLARKYLNKAQSSKDRGIPFTLSFADYKRLYNRKRCFYTGVLLEHDNNFSLDRIDSSIGYTKENTVPCDLAFNKLKGTVENPTFKLDLFKVNKAFNKVIKELK